MITLITGLPGNGKTLYALSWVKDWSERDDRQVFYSGIADLRLPWTEFDPEKWHTLPKGSIIVIDEVQRVMRPRMHGTKVPEFVEKLETHRHLGVDLVLITQNPMLLDSNVRRLVGQHKHIRRKFGSHWATIHEWTSVKDNCGTNVTDSMRQEWRYPKDVFALYKSAELHTVKRRIPFKIWLLICLPFIIGASLYWGFNKIDPKNRKGDQGGKQQQQVPNGSPPPVSASGGRDAPMSTAEYVKQFEPRIAGLAYTAPAYDEVTKATVAPYPAACVTMAERCSCYSQQGTVLAVPRNLCLDIVKGGFFVAWESKEHPEALHGAVERLERRDYGPAPAISLGGNPRQHIIEVKGSK